VSGPLGGLDVAVRTARTRIAILRADDLSALSTETSASPGRRSIRILIVDFACRAALSSGLGNTRASRRWSARTRTCCSSEPIPAAAVGIAHREG
jgi:hypothetical protein